MISPGCCATLDSIDFVKAHLAIPGCDECGAGLTITGKDNRAVVYHGYVIRTLYRLSPREPAETRDMASHVLFLGTHIDAVDCFLGAPGQHRLERRNVQETNPVFLRQSSSVGFGCSHPFRRRRR